MRTHVRCLILGLAVLAAACGDQPTEVVPEREMTGGPGGIANATSSTDDGLSITTDKDDYAPGDTVFFTGAGWPADDVLDIVLTDDPTHDRHEWTIDVETDGTFQDSTYVVDGNDLGVTFTLTATSRATGRSLTVQFTDANSTISAFTIVPSPVAPGGTLSWSATAICTGPAEPSANSCNDHGSSVDGPVPNTYTLNLLRADGVCGTPGQTFAQVATASTSGGTGTGGGTVSAPATPGFYAYRATHPTQSISGNNWPNSGGPAICVTVEVQGVSNQPPTVNAGGPYSGDEGSPISISGTASDPDGDAVTTTWSVDDGGYGTTICTIDDPSSLSTTVTCTDNGTFTLTLSGTDGKIATPVTSTASLTVGNVAPVVDITAPVDLTLYQLVTGLNIPISASFTDAGSNDTHTCKVEITKYLVTTTISSSTTDNGASGSCSATLSPTEAAVYTINVTVDDDDDGSGNDEVMVIVYDPTAGFVTGGGWIVSPYGAYPADPALTGKATFGFVSKYEKPKGTSTPSLTGNTEFVFHAADFNFHSSSYEYLLVNANGTRAQFKGTGTVNGEAGYGFLLTALDGNPDKFRIKIWDASGTVYDNQMGKDDSGNDATALSGGSIVIHVPKK